MLSKHRLLVCTLLTSVFLTFAGHANAMKKYVSDELGILMRKGETVQHAIIKGIQSGEVVELISTNPDSGYSLVKDNNGIEGYVLSRFLVNQPAARNRLKVLTKRFDSLTKEHQTLLSSFQTMQTQLGQQNQEIETLRTEKEKNTSTIQHLEQLSADPIRLQQSNSTLTQRNQELAKKIQVLETKEAELLNDKTLNWFISGSGVTLVSLLLGLMLSRINWRRRQQWGF